MSTNAKTAIDWIVESMAEILLRDGINPDDQAAAGQAWRLEGYGAGAVLAFGKRARIRAIGFLAVAAALLPLPAAAGELALVATEAGVKGPSSSAWRSALSPDGSSDFSLAMGAANEPDA